MKISRLFHWLYAILMLLPFVPVVSFGLYYAFNKNAVVPEVTKYESKEVDFNQYILSSYTFTSGSGYSLSDYRAGLNGYVSSSLSSERFTELLFTKGDKILVRISNITGNTTLGGLRVNTPSYSVYLNTTESAIVVSNGDYLYFSLFRNSGVSSTLYFYVNIFDLTQMFGVGNEPTIEEFNSWFPNDYYEYTDSKHIVIPNYREVTESDSPINHIWLPSFGGMGWTIKNIFTFLISTMFGISVVGGIGEVILYLLTYWLCISLIWLIYDVIMYVPLMIHRWLDKGVID